MDIEDYYKKLHTNPERSGKNKKYEVFYSWNNKEYE